MLVDSVSCLSALKNKKKSKSEAILIKYGISQFIKQQIDSEPIKLGATIQSVVAGLNENQNHFERILRLQGKQILSTSTYSGLLHFSRPILPSFQGYSKF